MTSCLKRRYLSWIIVFLVTFAKSLATKSNQTITVDQAIRAHVNKLHLSPTICYGRKPNIIPMENIQNELDELYEIEKSIHKELTEKQSDDPDKSIKYFYIDVVAVADYSLYKRFSFDSLALRYQIAYLFFGAKRVYLQNKFSLPGMFDFKIVLNLVDIIIIKNKEKSILYKIREGKKKDQIDVKKGISRLKTFAFENRKGSYDHITLFTALDLAMRENGSLGRHGIVGIAAKLGKMCYPMISISIVEDHWRGADMLTLVHEIGHSLGAGHDGKYNNCSANDDYLMTPKESGPSEESRNKWIFSECSRKEIAYNIVKQLNGGYVKYLKGLYDDAGYNLSEAGKAEGFQYICDCFRNKIPIKKSVPDVSKMFHGSYVNISYQCILRGSDREAPTDTCKKKLNTGHLPCIVRYCKRIINGERYCEGTIPYRGTSCGKNKVCEDGVCRSIKELNALKMNFSSNLTAPCWWYPEPKNSSRYQYDYGLKLVIVTLLFFWNIDSISHQLCSLLS